MQLRDDEAGLVCPERDVYRALLPWDNARVLELGCGRAEHTRTIADSFPGVRITALEVDPIQHAQNLAVSDLPNVRFAEGGAEAIPAADASFDIVLMFKSLHHVPTGLLDRALAEVHRVLAPGGVAYFSEPVFAGEYNEIVRIFHDEERVRAAAFAALRRSVEGGIFELVAERFFRAPVRFDSFAHFQQRVIGVTHTRHCLDEAQLAAVRDRFMRHVKADGATFLQPMRVDLLRKAA
jgi:SAM-dependent methyltransferase